MKIDVECYYVRDEHKAWGYFTVFKRGLSAFTDYGCFGFTFDPGERTAKEFLANMTETDYLLRKVSRHNWLDVDKTEKAFRRDLLHQRREGSITKERARELYDEMPSGEEDIVRWAMEHREWYETDGYQLAVYDFPPEASGFAERLFPVFREELRKECAAQTTPLAG